MSLLRRSLVLPVLTASLLLVGACSASTTTGTKAKTSATTAAASQSTTSRGASQTESTNAATSTTVASHANTGDGKVHLSGSFCDMIKQVSSEMESLMTPSSSTDPADQLKNLKQVWANIADAYHQIQRKAPAEIKDDIDFGVKAIDQINERVQKLTSMEPDEIAKIGGDLGSPEAQKHDDNLNAYAKDKCGFDPNADTSGSDTPN